LADSTAPILLHGDLHHSNIVRQGVGWIAIDPKGVMGPAEAEPAAFLRNPRSRLLASADLEATLLHRTHRVAKEMGYAPLRVAEWGYVLAVVAAAWSVEDGESEADVGKWLGCADALASVCARI
jgi:streptomycin 6-kinase